jgi:hypothetical protein
MFRIRFYACGMLAAAALVMAAPAGAVSLEMTKFSREHAASAQTKMSDFLSSHKVSNLKVETFEGQKAWNGKSGSANPQDTKVGSFKAAGKRGSGRSTISTGHKLQVRNDNSMKWGRYNSKTPAKNIVGNNWLDSNDNQRIAWTVKGDGKFNTVGLYLTDIADAGGKFSIKVGKTVFSDLAGSTRRLKSGTVHFVLITLDELVDSVRISLGHDRRNDGFGIDGAMVANVAPVPLPPAAALLLTGVVAIGGLRYRRKAVAA